VVVMDDDLDVLNQILTSQVGMTVSLCMLSSGVYAAVVKQPGNQVVAYSVGHPHLIGAISGLLKALMDKVDSHGK
jgi:hypothetical protein